ncbi:MAG TPA: serpin family protein, partial [Clostridia bacterium]|nr:serpin family protein [Clostridia bacterium]
MNYLKTGILKALIMFVLLALLINITACSTSMDIFIEVKAANLMENITTNPVEGKAVDEEFIQNTADFSIKLFKKTIKQGKNSLISPTSVMFALAMTANGADNKTLREMEEVLGNGISISDLNEYLYTYLKNLPSIAKSKLKIANSIWFRDDEERLTVEKDFLQSNADYYGADIYKSAFDDQTLKDINNWTKKNTDGMIDKILDQIYPDAVMYLLNAIVFDAEWEKIYSKDSVYQGTFNAADGSKQAADFMNSEEHLYIEDASATGFIKPYAGNKYAFAAILPNAGVSVDEYIASLSGEKFIDLIKGAVNTKVTTAM